MVAVIERPGFERHTNHLQVAGAGDSCRAFLGSPHRRHQKAREEQNEGNDDQQFDERKRPGPSFFGARTLHQCQNILPLVNRTS